MKRVSFTAKSGRVIELMRFDKPGPNQGDSLRRLTNRKFIYRPAGTDISVDVSLPRREPDFKKGGLKPRADRTVSVDGMSSDARFGPAASKPSPTQLLKVGRRGGALADKANVPVIATAGWFGPRPSKGSAGVIDYAKENRRLGSAYRALGMVKDRAKIKSELGDYAGTSLRARRRVAQMLRSNPPLIRMPRGRRQS
jgi:hypothetical protein